MMKSHSVSNIFNGMMMILAKKQHLIEKEFGGNS